MSWINSELPDGWPSKGAQDDSVGPAFDTSASHSGESVVAEPTVAIQTRIAENTPQWKEAIKPPQAQQQSYGATRLFDPPQLEDLTEEAVGSSTLPSAPVTAAAQADNMSDTSASELSLRNDSNQSHDSAPMRPINRRLKVFGRPDTYTNERLGNLLSSMGAGGTSGSSTAHPTNPIANSVTNSGIDQSVNHTANFSANESDVDIADHLQSEGRKVLQGLQFRPNLSAVPESSLDELEQQLTSQGTSIAHRMSKTFQPPYPSDQLDTTSSLVDHSNSGTLDSLPAGISNWDTAGGPHGDRLRELHRASSRTLCGSGKSRTSKVPDSATQNTPHHSPQRREPTARVVPEEEVSALGIQQPMSSEPMESDSFRNSVYNYHPDEITSSEQLSTSDRVSSTDRNTRRTNSRASQSLSQALEMSPDYTIAYDFLKFDRRPRPSHVSPQKSGGGIPRPSGEHSFSGAPGYDKSIAERDVSFSVAYEHLANVIRERTRTAELTEVDSLDLNDCDIESVVGLDKFVPNLTTLFLNNNAVRNVKGLPFNLVHLDLTSNLISSLNVFSPSFISTLILANNELVNLEPLKNLRALSSLDVSNNGLTSLRGIGALTALRNLNVRGNKLTTLDINLGMLVELDAAQNQLRAVTLEAPNLESLDLEGNNLVAFDEPLPNLRELNIRFNEAVIDCKGWLALETLLMDGNKGIRNLESVAGNLVTFSWEQARGEASQPLNWSELCNTRDLKLGGSRRGWPLGVTPKLVFATQHLDLVQCGIRELPFDFANRFPFLKSLNLALNKLDNRCIAILSRCKQLERVSVYGNRLTVVGQQLAAELPLIRVLDSRDQGLTSQAQQQLSNSVKSGEFASEVYTNLTEAHASTSTVVTKCPKLQQVDGKWTQNRSQISTTRPGFPSALYPVPWEPPSEKRAGPDGSLADTTTIDASASLEAWDLVEAAYVHHWLQLYSGKKL